MKKYTSTALFAFAALLSIFLFSFQKKSGGDKNPPKYFNTRSEMPFDSLVPTLSSTIPEKVRPHSHLLLTDIEDRPFFDFFSWQMFVALIWPADKDNRGVPDDTVTAENFKNFNTGSEASRRPVLWQSFRSAKEILTYDPNAKVPAWNEDKPFIKPQMFTQFSKGNKIDQIREAFSHPLIDQNHQYVLYNVRFNEVLYEYIRRNEWYLKGNLPANPTQASVPPLPVVSPVPTHPILKDQYLGTPPRAIYQPQSGTLITASDPHTLVSPQKNNSITIKTAWRVMITDTENKKWRIKDDLSRYYVIDAKTLDLATEDTINVKLGLVGIHIVQKTAQFTEGIWSSFEHIDNLKAPPGKNKRASFFSGKKAPDKRGYDTIPSNNLEPNERNRTPVEVSRVYKIPDTPKGSKGQKHYPYEKDYSTQGLNKMFRNKLKGTVWENYQLVITQWPTDPTTFYARNYFFPRGISGDSTLQHQPPAVQQAYARAKKQAEEAYPRYSGLPIPQVGALNIVMETYFQNPQKLSEMQPLENTSCMGCHYGASDTDYNWTLRNHTYPQPFEQKRIWGEDASVVSDFSYKKIKGN